VPSEHAISFEHVIAGDEQARLVMDWRNDPVTLSMSFHQQPKTWPGFRDELARLCHAEPAPGPVFAVIEGQRVAFLSFEPVVDPERPRRRCVRLSINVAPSRRGDGMGTAVLRAANRHLAACGAQSIVADVKPENGASLKAFARAGYRELGRAVRTFSDLPAPVNVVRFVRDLVPLLRIPGTPRAIGPGEPCFVIAEAGSNWRMGTPRRDRAMAFALIDAAADAGADAVKFQTYRPETVYAENAGKSEYLAQAGIRQDIREIFADLSMPYEMIPELAARCAEKGILFMSTPFSVADTDALDPHVAIHKLASYEVSHLRLIQRLAASGKPVLMSTGAADLADVAWAVETFRAADVNGLALLQCTARYPAPEASLNLASMATLAERFGVPVGLSDHSRDAVIGPVAAVALGASVIEKHYTLANALPGPDHAFAITAAELKQLVESVRRAEATVGTGIKDVQDVEQELLLFARRRVQAVKAIAPGEPLREGHNVDILRPGQQKAGVHPRELPAMEGRPSRRAIQPGDGIQRGDWEEAG
jgi:sialic acid synthase SpsE/L-amino acid N-acyltransferase YncA